MAELPRANLVRKRLRNVRRVSTRSNRVNGQAYDAPIHKHDFGPLYESGTGPLNEKLPVFEGTYENYRRCDRLPHIAMAREWKLGPVRNAVGTWKTKDNTVSDDQLRFTQDTLEPFIAGLINSLSDALSMGNSPNQIVWDTQIKTIAGAPSVQWIPRDVWPLTHDSTSVIVPESNHRIFAGLSTEDGDLAPEECIYFRYDPRPYDGYWWYGRSLHENHRREAAEYEEDRQLMHRLARKLSGVVAIAKIIKGMARDSKGRVIDRFDAAKKIVEYLYNSMGAVFESIGVSEDELKRNPKLAEISDIMVEAKDFGSSSPAYETMLKKRQQLQREMIMGYLVPPAAVMDPDTGGKADTEEKSETGLTQSEVVGLMIHEVINKQFVNPFLILNYGPDAKDTIYRSPTKFTEEQRRASDRVMSAIVNQPEIFRAALRTIDIAQVYRDTNTPALSNTDSIDLGKLLDEEAKKNDDREIAKSKATAPTKAQPIPGSTRTKQGKNRGANA